MPELKPTALLVEDEKQIRRFVRTALEGVGWAVHEAETMGAGLSAASTRNPDLIILDLGLPDGDGMELLRDLRTWSKVAVIVLSARVAEEDKVGFPPTSGHRAISPTRCGVTSWATSHRHFSIFRRRTLYRGADWCSVFGAVGCGEVLGVVIAARGSMRSTERCIQAIFAAHHDAGWRASLWITVLVDGCRGGTVAEARRELGAFGQVLNVRAQSPQELYRIGADAIEQHFGSKGGATMVFTTPELVDGLELLEQCA